MLKNHQKPLPKSLLLVTVILLCIMPSCNKIEQFAPWCPSDENCILYFSPSFISFNQENTQTLNVKIHNGDNILSIYFNIYYNSSLLSVKSLSVSLGTESFFSKEDSVIVKQSDFHVNDTLGIIQIGLLGRKENFNGVSGDGDLITLQLEKKASHISTLIRFENVEIYTWPLLVPPEPNTNVTITKAWIDL